MKVSILKRKSEFSRGLALLMVLALLLSVNVMPQASVDAATPANGTWTLMTSASDEFDGTALDASKWNNGIWYDVSSSLAFKDTNVSVSGGNLVLTAKKESYNGKAYTIGAVESKFDVPGADSYVEVRAKCLDSRANVLSAIWMQSSPLAYNYNPNPEIDIQETFSFTKLTSTLHTWNVSPSIHWQHAKNAWNTGVNVSSDFHIYGLERRNGKLKFYFDGVLAWEKTPSTEQFVNMSRHMVLSLEGHLGNPVDTYLPSDFLVDYVRTYYDASFTNMPADGTYKIVNRKSGKVLNVPNSATDDNTQLIQFPYQGGNNEKWILKNLGDSIYTITNVGNGKCVDRNQATSNGTAVIQYTANSSNNQNWMLVPTDNGYFKIISTVTGKVLCVKDASTADGAKIIQWSYGSALNDQWQIVAP